MNTKKIIVFILLLAIFYNIFRSFKLFDFKKVFNNKFDIKKYEKLYNKSQWVIPNSKNPVGDDIVYTYAGAKYINGENPIMINAEHPPMLKNLIGIFAVYFRNEYLFGLFSGIFAVATFYLLASLIIKDKLISILLSVLLFFEPLMVANYFLTLLDLITFGFINLYFYFLLKYIKQNKTEQIFIMNIILGLVISSKFFLLSTPLIGATAIYLLATKKFKGLFYYLIFMFVSLLILIANYWQFFLKGKNIIDFLKLQKYIYVFQSVGRKNATYLNSSLFSLVFSGKYFINLDKIGYENHYSIIWPISFLLTGIGILIKRVPIPIVLWIIFYCGSMIFSLPSSRYLILLLPYLYLISTSFVLSERKAK